MINKIRNLVLTIFALHASLTFAQVPQHPNVILIITDDQGYGDLGITGNPHVNSPVIDKLSRESIRFNNFYVSPVCAPTRSSLMTGRYSLRTGVRDTYNGGAMMASNEITIAEMLKVANYKTGIFGKWHLGDNYPGRPGDQGFDESLIHLSGGMGQVGDVTTYFKGDSSYFDPVLWHNGKQQSYQGYCSDIFARQAIDFIEQSGESPFFCYLSFNAPHTPLQVPDSYYQPYKNIDPAAGFANDKRPFPKMSEQDKEYARRSYAMITNIDDNIGKVLKKLEELKIADNTIVIFMTDNGPQHNRYLSGLRGAKGSVYEGGIKVPFYLKYPALLKGNKDIQTAAAHIDVYPTLAKLCNVRLPNETMIDGKNLLPIVRGEQVNWADRSLFFYWSRRYPEFYNNMALQKDKYKLVGHTDYNAAITDFELFNLGSDPYEQTNVVGKNKLIADDLKLEMDQLLKELVASENLIHAPRIVIGSDQENPTLLNRNDADGQSGIWAQEEIYGLWRVSINEGHYNLRFKFLNSIKERGQLCFEAQSFIKQIKNDKTGIDLIEMKDVYLPALDCDFTPYYSAGAKKIFPFSVEIEKIK